MAGNTGGLTELACRDAACAPPPVGTGGSSPSDSVSDATPVKRNRAKNIDTERLNRRRARLISEITNPNHFYPGGRNGFAMRAAELTAIESELEQRGELARKDRQTATTKPEHLPDNLDDLRKGDVVEVRLTDLMARPDIWFDERDPKYGGRASGVNQRGLDALVPELGLKVEDGKTSVGGEEWLDILGRSIAAEGQREPLIISRQPDGTYWLAEGNHRLAAMERAGVQTVKITRGGDYASQQRSVDIPSTAARLGPRSVSASAVIELACRDKSCAPPPVGAGGSEPEGDYRMEHTAPDRESGAAAHDLTGGNQVYPPDFWDNPHFYWYNERAIDKEVTDILRRVKGNPDAEVTIYRSLPPEHAADGINPKDWVTLSKAYAEGHGMHPDDPSKDWPVVSRKVRAGDLFTAGDSLAEWGWDPEDAMTAALIELACREASCAPPPAGVGGSTPAERTVSIPHNVGGSDANLKNYKGDFKVPGVAKLKERFGSTTAQAVEHFAQYGIDLTIDDWAASSDFAHERLGTLLGLDEMAKRYPDTMSGMAVHLKMSGGFGETVAAFMWPPKVDGRQIDIEMNATWLLGRDATANEKRRLYAAGVIHEVGHALTYDAVGRDAKAFRELQFANETTIGGVKIDRGSEKVSVSSYGATNIAEDIAESFTAHVLGIDAPDEAGRAWVANHVKAIAAGGTADKRSVVYLFAVAERADALTSALIELACYEASCRPPTSGGTGGSSPAPFSTRKITSKKVEHQMYGLGTELDEVPVATAAKQAVRLVENTSGFGGLMKHPGMKKDASEEDQKALIDAVVNQITDNVVEVYDRSETPELSRHWYDAANTFSHDLSKQYGVSPETAAAVIATLSPQADWNHNVKLAHLVLEKVTGASALTPDDIKAVNQVAVQQYDAAVEAWIKRGRKPKSEPVPPTPLDPTQVTRFDQLSNTEAAYWVRHAAGEVHAVPEMVLTGGSEYAFNPPLRNKDGAETALRWQSYGALAAAVSVIRNPSDTNISDQLGGGHKVRSFYNNIAFPNADQPDVTADTHAFGVALRMPLTSSHPLIKSGSSNIYGTPSDIVAGTSGVHVLIAEGYRRATQRVNRRKNRLNPPLRPREMQSITWEQWKKDYPAEFRSTGEATGTLPRSEALLQQYDAGILSKRELREGLAEVRRNGDE